MRILATCFVYNEKKYIDQWVKWYRSQGCELFVLDNMSDDGTYEYLISLGVNCQRIDTDGAFHLHELQNELMKHIHQLQPDWVCYTGADLFIITKNSILEDVKTLNASGYDQIILPCFNMVNTGEIFGLPLQIHYVRGGFYRDLALLGKYSINFSILNDNVGKEKTNPIKINGLIVNYGGCKPVKEQNIKLERRQKAWNQGLPSNIGRHFRTGNTKKWVYKIEETEDITKTESWEFIKKIQGL